MYDRQSLTTLQRNNTNVHLTDAAWRAAVSAGVAIRRPTKRGCRGGAHRQQKIVPIVGHRPDLICVGEATGSNATNLRQCSLIDSNIIHASKLCICTLNPWSVFNKTTTLHDFIIDQQLDIFALTETWLTGTDTDNPIISALLPNGYTIIDNPEAAAQLSFIAIVSQLQKSQIRNPIRRSRRWNVSSHQPRLSGCPLYTGHHLLRETRPRINNSKQSSLTIWAL